MRRNRNARPRSDVQSRTTARSLRRRPLAAAGLVLSTGLVLVGTVACADEEGSGDLAVVSFEDFDDPVITGIDVRGDFDVRVTIDPAAPQSASVLIDDNLVDRGWADVDDGVLTLDYDGFGEVHPSRMPVITLAVQSLDHIENHGTGAILVNGISGDELDVINADNGEIAATGTIDTVTVRSTSDGGVNLSALVARQVTLDDTDDGPIAVTATEVVDGEISGDADVTLHGSADSSGVTLDGDGQLVTAA
jgi:hypothetical protein